MRTARRYRGTRRNVEFLAARLRAGELVAVPTETVYGLAGDAFSAAACRRIFAAKGRPANDPLIVHIHSLAQLGEVAEANEAAGRLARAFWPGPLTMVLPKQARIPDAATSGRPTVAVRMSAHPLFRRLLRAAGRPLAAPSANPFGYISPTRAEHVEAGLGRKIRHILDGGPCAVGVESTIVDVSHPEKPRLLRPGAITRRQLERVLGRPVGKGRSARVPSAPGQFPRHYSPRVPVKLHRSFRAAAIERSAKMEAWIFQRRPKKGLVDRKNVFWLAEDGSTEESARNLFAVLRRADRKDFSRIHVELAEGEGLAEAVNDRLRRAAGPRI